MIPVSAESFCAADMNNTSPWINFQMHSVLTNESQLHYQHCMELWFPIAVQVNPQGMNCKFPGTFLVVNGNVYKVSGLSLTEIRHFDHWVVSTLYRNCI